MATHRDTILGTRPGVHTPPLIWYPEWVIDAKCREFSIAETDYAFFDHHQSKEIQDWAKGICRACPVINQCLQYGMNIPYGIFGGKTANERWQMTHSSKRADKTNVSWYGELV